jgi:hypothetical protein
MKPRVLIYVLCGHERTAWICPPLFSALFNLKDERLDITVDLANGFRPFERARNWSVIQARDRGFDALVMIDNDMVLPENFADIIHESITSGKPVVGLKAGATHDDGRLWVTACHDNGRLDGNFRRTGFVGSGVLFISSEVWQKIPTGPWFRWLSNDDEEGTPKTSEDFYFCELVQKDAAGHLKTLNVTRVCQALGRDKER